MDDRIDDLWRLVHWIDAWVISHDSTINKAALWTLCIGFGLLGCVKLLLWMMLRGNRDQTAVGRALKTQKFSEAILYLALSSLYGLVLYSVHTSYEFSIWQQMGLRIVAMVSIVIAATFGLRFMHAYHSEGWGRASAGIKQSLLDAQELDRNERQGIRENNKGIL